jgi:mRNA-degrading endonuclease toxin of MazEF toxin-antitoxin module
MSFSRGDVVWLRTDNLEGGLGKVHPAVVISNNAFNDSHDWGYITRGSHLIPREPGPEDYVVKHDAENKLDRDTIFGAIVQSAHWSRMSTTGGKVRPRQLRALVDRVSRVLAS